MKIRFLFATALFYSLSLQAQQFVLSGKITDLQGQPLPFASIYQKNTTRGTSANAEGEYRLSLPAGKYEMVVKAMGYRSQSHLIDLNSSQQWQVVLEEEAYQLKDVVVRADAEDPAYAIIRQAIKKRKSYLNELRAYQTEVYVKGLQKLLSAPKKFMGVDIDQVGKQLGLDSNRRGIIYLSESESRLSYERPNQYREEMISSKVAGSNRSFSFNRATDLQVNFYENFQNWEGLSMRPLVSPIADNALLYYDYKFLGNAVENGEMINKIQFSPKRSTDPVFEGSIYILEDSWRIHSIDAFVTKKANLNFVDTLRVQQQFLPVQRNAWMPSSLRFEFNGAFLGFRFAGYYVAMFRNYDLNPSFAKNEFKEALKISREVNKKDSTYWQESRPIPLTEEEKTDYQKKEVLAAKRQSKPYLDSLDKAGNKFKLSKVILGGYRVVNRYERKIYTFNSLMQAWFYNTVEGFGVQPELTYTHRLDTLTNKYLMLTGQMRYGFSNQHFNAGIRGTYQKGQTVFRAKLASEVLDLNSRATLPSVVNTYSTLFSEKNPLKLYEKRSISADVSGRVGPNIRVDMNVEWAHRQHLRNTSTYSFRDVKDREFSSNNPYSPELDAPLFPDNQSFKLSFGASYDFSSRYVTYPSGKYFIASKYPTLGIRYNKAIAGVFGSDVSFDQLQISLSKQEIKMGFYGKTGFQLLTGKFFNRGVIYYTDYHHFARLQTLMDNESRFTYLFPDYYLSATPDRYFQAHVEHNFSGFILNKVPLLRKLKLQELAGLNYMSTPVYSNFREWYMGIQWLNFRMYYGWSYTSLGLQSQGFRFSMRLN